MKISTENEVFHPYTVTIETYEESWVLGMMLDTNADQLIQSRLPDTELSKFIRAQSNMAEIFREFGRNR